MSRFLKQLKKLILVIIDSINVYNVGGVTLLRAAAKNHSRVTILSDPLDYPKFMEELKSSFNATQTASISDETRKYLALKAFTQTAEYDEAISGYFRQQYAGNGLQHLTLRYGANPHQKPAQVLNTKGPLPFKGIIFIKLPYRI